MRYGGWLGCLLGSFRVGFLEPCFKRKPVLALSGSVNDSKSALSLQTDSEAPRLLKAPRAVLPRAGPIPRPSPAEIPDEAHEVHVLISPTAELSGRVPQMVPELEIPPQGLKSKRQTAF